MHCAGICLSWKTYVGNIRGGHQLPCSILYKYIGDVAHARALGPYNVKVEVTGFALKPSIVWLSREFKRVLSYLIFIRDVTRFKFFTFTKL